MYCDILKTYWDIKTIILDTSINLRKIFLIDLSFSKYLQKFQVIILAGISPTWIFSFLLLSRSFLFYFLHQSGNIVHLWFYFNFHFYEISFSKTLKHKLDFFQVNSIFCFFDFCFLLLLKEKKIWKKIKFVTEVFK